MIRFLATVALSIFWTVFAGAIVALEEPPAFVAHLFGIVTGLSWALPFLWHWIRQDKERDGRD